MASDTYILLDNIIYLKDFFGYEAFYKARGACVDLIKETVRFFELSKSDAPIETIEALTEMQHIIHFIREEVDREIIKKENEDILSRLNLVEDYMDSYLETFIFKTYTQEQKKVGLL